MLRPQRLRIAWFSDTARGRAESVCAYTSRLLLPRLAQDHSIEVFSDSFSTSEFGLPHFHYLTAYRRHATQAFDLFFYQLEDGPHSRFARGHIGLVPGVVWIHDLFCRDLGPEACHTSPWEQSVKQFYDSSLPFYDRSKAPHQLWPRLYRETSLCPLVFLSSAWAHAEFRCMTSNRLEAEEGGHCAQVLNLPVRIPGELMPRSSKEVFTIACASGVGIEGRAHKFLPAMRSLQVPWKLVWMIQDHERLGAQALLHEFGIPMELVELCDGRSPERWAAVVRDSHCALHLHTSSFGGLAPYVQISMAHSCPTIIACSAQGEDVPESAAFHITPGVHELEQLRQVLNILRGNMRGSLGRAGYEYIRQEGEVEHIAQQLSNTLLAYAPQVAYVMERWNSLRTRAQRVLVDEVRQLVDGTGTDEISPFARVIRPALDDLGW